MSTNDPLKGESEPLSRTNDLERAVNESQEKDSAVSAPIEGVIGAPTVAMSTDSAPFGEVEDVALPDVGVVGREEANMKLPSEAPRRRIGNYEDEIDEEHLLDPPQDHHEVVDDVALPGVGAEGGEGAETKLPSKVPRRRTVKYEDEIDEEHLLGPPTEHDEGAEDVALPDIGVVEREDANTKLLSEAPRRRIGKYEDELDKESLLDPSREHDEVAEDVALSEVGLERRENADTTLISQAPRQAPRRRIRKYEDELDDPPVQTRHVEDDKARLKYENGHSEAVSDVEKGPFKQREGISIPIGTAAAIVGAPQDVADSTDDNDIERGHGEKPPDEPSGGANVPEKIVTSDTSLVGSSNVKLTDDEIDEAARQALANIIKNVPQHYTDEEEAAIEKGKEFYEECKESKNFDKLKSPDSRVKMKLVHVDGASHGTGVATTVVDACVEECAAYEFYMDSREFKRTSKGRGVAKYNVKHVSDHTFYYFLTRELGLPGFAPRDGRSTITWLEQDGGKFIIDVEDTEELKEEF